LPNGKTNTRQSITIGGVNATDPSGSNRPPSTLAEDCPGAEATQ
jgi:hypothetical protein